MTVTLDTHVAVSVAPLLPEALVSAPALADLQRVAAQLPAALTEFFGLECSLTDPDARADFLVHVTGEHGGRAVLTNAVGDGAPPGRMLAEPAWQRVCAFAKDWARPDSPLQRHVQGMWLEFDIGQMGAVPAPSAFFGTESLRSRDTEDRVVDVEWLFRDALPPLMDAPVRARLEPVLRRAIAALPRDAWIFQVGVMLMRSTDAVRICVRGLNASNALEYLQAIGWPGPLDDFAHVLRDAYSRSDSVDMDLDVSASVHPKVGLECSFLPRPETQSRQKAFIGHLAVERLCTREKAAALLAWPRGLHERSNPAKWPVDLRQRAQALGGGTVSMFLRWLYHIKLVYEPGQPMAAKAYLAVRQFWLDPAKLERVVALQEQLKD